MSGKSGEIIDRGGPRKVDSRIAVPSHLPPPGWTPRVLESDIQGMKDLPWIPEKPAALPAERTSPAQPVKP